MEGSEQGKRAFGDIIMWKKLLLKLLGELVKDVVNAELAKRKEG